MVSCMFLISYLQVLEKSDSKVLNFWMFVELFILDWYSTQRIKHVIITVNTYFHWNFFSLCCLLIQAQLVCAINYYGVNAPICSQMVLFICKLYVPELRDIARYDKVYHYFTIPHTKCVQDWDPIMVISAHKFTLCQRCHRSNRYIPYH